MPLFPIFRKINYVYYIMFALTSHFIKLFLKFITIITFTMFFIVVIENTVFIILVISTSFTILFHSLILLSEASETRTRNHAIKSRGLFQLSYSFIKYKDLITLRLKLYSSFLPIIELLAIPSFANLFNNWAEFCKLSRRFGYSLSGFNENHESDTGRRLFY